MKEALLSIPGVADAQKRPAKEPRQKTRRETRLQRTRERERFRRVHLSEKKWKRQLRSVSKQVGAIVRAMAPGGVVRDPGKLTQTLQRYAEVLTPWAEDVSRSLVEEVAKRDAKEWIDLGKTLGRSLGKEIASAPTGQVMREKMAEQVGLIKSLPIEAAQRVHGLTIEAMAGGTRAREIADEIMKTERVTRARADLIARTETGRTASAFLEARSVHVGSKGYIWRTADDVDVRKSHADMEGEFVPWDRPPTLDGMTGHAGALPNCRCWSEPILPDVIE